MVPALEDARLLSLLVGIDTLCDLSTKSLAFLHVQGVRSAHWKRDLASRTLGFWHYGRLSRWSVSVLFF